MNYMFLFAGLLLLGVAPPVAAQSVDCVPSHGCPADMEPPDCCEPPPCEFFYELRYMRALHRLNSPELAEFATQSTGGDVAKGQELYDHMIKFRNRNDAIDVFHCRVNKGLDGGPTKFEVDSSCRVGLTRGDGFVDVTLNEALAGFDSCNEIIEAKYASAEARRRSCLAGDQPTTLEEKVRANWRTTSDQVSELENALRQYWSACSAVADAETARKLADEGIDVLKEVPPTKPPKMKTPPREAPPSEAPTETQNPADTVTT